MLGSDKVADVHRPSRAINEDGPAPALERGRDLGAAGRLGHEPLDRLLDGQGDVFGPGDQPGQAVRAVLSLDDQVEGGIGGGGAGVGDHYDLGRPGEGGGHSDRSLLGHQTLSRSHVEVARAHDDVHGTDGLGTVGHGGDGLGAADGVDLVHPGYGRGGQDGGGHPAVGARRRAHHHLGHARHLGGQDRHEHSRRQRGAATRCVAAGPAHRDQPFPGDHPVLTGVLEATMSVPFGLVKAPDGAGRRFQRPPQPAVDAV